MPLDKILKRHFWAVILLLTGIAAFFGAQGMMQFVGLGIGATDKDLAAPPLSARLPPVPVVASPHLTNADAFLHRNPFDSVTGDLFPKEPEAEIDAGVAEPAPPPGPWEAPDCEGVQLLVIAASPDPDWSFAALETTQDKGKSFLRRRGDDLNGKTVEFIGWNRVWLRSGSQRCQAQMFKPPAPPAASSGAPALPPPPETPPGGGVPADLKAGIAKVGPIHRHAIQAKGCGAAGPANRIPG